MQRHEDFFAGRKDRKIYRQWWLPAGEAKAAVLIVHGLAEHSGRYDPLVRHLVPQAYAVYGFDHLGHGRSEGPRCHADELADFIDNLQRMVLWVKEQQPGKPLLLFGHSMGGLITANYLIDHQSEVDAAVLSAPAVRSANPPGFAQKLKVGLLHRLRPQAGFSKLEAAGISRNPDVVEAYKRDPLVHNGAMSIGLALVMGSAMSRLSKEAGRIKLPLLIVQGEQDSLVDPAGAKVLYEWVGSADKKLESYPEAYHELLNEPEAPELLQLLDSWLTERFARPE